MNQPQSTRYPLSHLASLAAALGATYACSGDIGGESHAVPTEQSVPTPATEPAVAGSELPTTTAPGAAPSLAPNGTATPTTPAGEGPIAAPLPTVVQPSPAPDADGVPILDSGRTVLRRLTKAEYGNTVRDLLQTTASPAADFTAADTVAEEGFDTIGAVLTLPPVLFDQYESAATKLVDELFARPVGDPIRAALLLCEGAEDTCARSALESFATRAFRRPVGTSEIDALMALKTSAEELQLSAEEGLMAAFRAVLLSPHFLFRVERSSRGNVSAEPLTQFELATRLSYFLWSSMPDPELTALAEAGTLTTDLSNQLERMLEDSKAKEFALNFAGQWLHVRDMEEFEPPSQLVFPDYDERLSESAKQETLTFFELQYSEGRPLTELLTADYTIADARLAEHYGLSLPSEDFQRASLEGLPRRGVLTQASFLISSSHPGSTSPTRRGKMVLERFMCLSILAPPEIDTELTMPEPGMTRREQMAAHSADPACNVCHQLMDPIGFGFENFDAVGAYRTEDNGGVVDASGELPTANGNLPFSSPVELAMLLAEDPRYPACVTEQLLTYGVGRSFATPEAKAYTSALAQQALADGRSDWRTWLEHVVTSEAFLTRRGEAE